MSMNETRKQLIFVDPLYKQKDWSRSDKLRLTDGCDANCSIFFIMYRCLDQLIDGNIPHIV